MKIYVHDERTKGALEALCVSYGVEVISWKDVVGFGRAPRSEDAQQPLIGFLHQVDAVCIEITEPTQEMQFIIAHALLTQKPTLCLYSKNYPPRELLSYIKQQPQPRSIKTFSYVAHSLPAAVHRFLRMHSEIAEDRADLATIKYTLRLTPRVDRYVQWRADAEGLSKADLIRDIFVDMANTDERYRAALTLFDDE